MNISTEYQLPYYANNFLVYIKLCKIGTKFDPIAANQMLLYDDDHGVQYGGLGWQVMIMQHSPGSTTSGPLREAQMLVGRVDLSGGGIMH